MWWNLLWTVNTCLESHVSLTHWEKTTEMRTPPNVNILAWSWDVHFSALNGQWGICVYDSSISLWLSLINNIMTPAILVMAILVTFWILNFWWDVCVNCMHIELSMEWVLMWWVLFPFTVCIRCAVFMTGNLWSQMGRECAGHWQVITGAGSSVNGLCAQQVQISYHNYTALAERKELYTNSKVLPGFELQFMVLASTPKFFLCGISNLNLKLMIEYFHLLIIPSDWSIVIDYLVVYLTRNNGKNQCARSRNVNEWWNWNWKCNTTDCSTHQFHGIV